ncbi:MAG TPA: hypothetical protein VFL14_09190, partial [Xanthomonadales bacterium]|nr:hypothetical protein [Xanthomonadales bacterium]
LRARGSLERAGEVLRIVEQRAAAELPANDPLRNDIELAQIAVLQRTGQWQDARVRVDRLLAELPVGAIAQRATALASSAYVAGGAGEHERAERDGVAAVALARSANDEATLQAALRALGSLRIDAGDGAAAVPVFEELLATDRARYGDTHASIAEEEAALARAHRLAGHREEALAHGRRAVAIGDAVYPPDHWLRGLHRNALVMALIENRAFDEAADVQREALRLDRLNRAESDPNLVMAWGTQAIVLGAIERWDEAAAADEEALRLALAQGDPRARLVGRLRLFYGYVLAMRGRRDEGEKELAEALAVARALGDDEFAANVTTQQARVALNVGDLAAAGERIAALDAISRDFRDRPNWPGRVGTFVAEHALASGDATRAREALADASREMTGVGRVDPIVATSHALLAAAIAPGDTALRDAARAKLGSLPFPPPHVRRLATAAGLD